MSLLRAAVATLSLVLAVALPAPQAVSVSAPGTVVSVVAPATWAPDGGSFEVRVEVREVAELGAFELKLAFDPVVLAFDAVEAGAFLGSTGRSVGCSKADFFTPQYDIFAFACTTDGQEPPGPSGGGVLATARFHPVGRGPSPMHLSSVSLLDILGREIAASVEHSTVTVGRSAGAPAPIATPAGPREPPSGPTLSPSPSPPGYEILPLGVGCTSVVSTYPDATPIGQIAGGVSPDGILAALWQFEAGIWQGYSPQFRAVSDLTETGSGDTLFACVTAAGRLLRPLA